MAAPLSSAQAYNVEAGSTSNRLYVAIYHPDASYNFSSVALHTTTPDFIAPPAPVYIPGAIAPQGGRILGLSFDVNPATSLNTQGDLTVRVTGYVNGQPVVVTEIVSLTVTTGIQAVQGTIVGTVGGLGALDTDGDGTTDLDEIANGTDPFVDEGASGAGALPPPTEPPSEPAGPAPVVPVPVLTAPVAGALAALLALSGWVGARRSRARSEDES